MARARRVGAPGQVHVWSALAAESADIEALAVFPELRRGYDEGLIDPQTIGRSELDDVEAGTSG